MDATPAGGLGIPQGGFEARGEVGLASRQRRQSSLPLGGITGGGVKEREFKTIAG